MKLEIEQEFLDITVRDLEDMESEICELRCRISEKRDILFSNWIKERTPRVRFSEIKSSDNEVIPEYDTKDKW